MNEHVGMSYIFLKKKKGKKEGMEIDVTFKPDVDCERRKRKVGGETFSSSRRKIKGTFFKFLKSYPHPQTKKKLTEKGKTVTNLL